MALAGLRHALKAKVRPWISTGKDRFDTLDQLFDCAAASEFKPDDKKPGGQQQQRQAGDSNSKGQQGSLREAAIRNENFEHPSPNLWKTLPAIPIIPPPVIQIRPSPISPVEAAVPTIYSAGAYKASLQKPKGKPAMHSLQQRRPLYLICNLG
jgi:hypothetical protein